MGLCGSERGGGEAAKALPLSVYFSRNLGCFSNVNIITVVLGFKNIIVC